MYLSQTHSRHSRELFQANVRIILNLMVMSGGSISLQAHCVKQGLTNSVLIPDFTQLLWIGGVKLGTNTENSYQVEWTCI